MYIIITSFIKNIKIDVSRQTTPIGYLFCIIKLCKTMGILKCLCRNCERKNQLVRDIFASVVNSDKFKDKMNQFNQIE